MIDFKLPCYLSWFEFFLIRVHILKDFNQIFLFVVMQMHLEKSGCITRIANALAMCYIGIIISFFACKTDILVMCECFSTADHLHNPPAALIATIKKLQSGYISGAR